MCDQIRGKSVKDAEAILALIPKAASDPLARESQSLITPTRRPWGFTFCPIYSRPPSQRSLTTMVIWEVRFASDPLAKLVHAAAANAENNHGMDPEKLYVAEAFACPGSYGKCAS